MPVAQSISAAIELALSTLRSLLFNAGPSMRKHLLTCSTAVINSFKDVMQSLAEADNANSSKKDAKKKPKKLLNVNQLTGVVLEACKELEFVPTQNRQAVSKDIMQQLQMIKDAAKECAKMRENAMKAAEEEGEQGEEGEKTDEEATTSSSSSSKAEAEGDSGV